MQKEAAKKTGGRKKRYLCTQCLHLHRESVRERRTHTHTRIRTHAHARAHTHTRYLCTKCFHLFWGWRKDVVAHLRRQGIQYKRGRVHPCLADMTPEEQAFCDARAGDARVADVQKLKPKKEATRAHACGTPRPLQDRPSAPPVCMSIYLIES